MSSSRSAIWAARPLTRGSSDSGLGRRHRATGGTRRRRVSTPTTMSAPTARIRNRTNPPETPPPSSVGRPGAGARAGGPAARRGHPRQPRLRQPLRHRDRPRHGVAAERGALRLERLLDRPRGQARPDRQVARRQHQDVPAVAEPLPQAHRVALRVGRAAAPAPRTSRACRRRSAPAPTPAAAAGRRRSAARRPPPRRRSPPRPPPPPGRSRQPRAGATPSPPAGWRGGGGRGSPRERRTRGDTGATAAVSPLSVPGRRG